MFQVATLTGVLVIGYRKGLQSDNRFAKCQVGKEKDKKHHRLCFALCSARINQIIGVGARASKRNGSDVDAEHSNGECQPGPLSPYLCAGDPLICWRPAVPALPAIGELPLAFLTT